MAQGRTAEEITRELDDVLNRLSSDIATLVTEVHPKLVTYRALDGGKRLAKDSAAAAVAKLRDTVDGCFKRGGQWRWDRVALVAGVALSAVGLGVALSLRKKQ